MLRRLFAGLTETERREQSLWDALVAVSADRRWYDGAGIADTMDGRFKVLASCTALAIVRLEQFGADGEAASVGVTERFVESMDAEMRQLGLGDPGLGKQVRAMVGALAARVELWRAAVDDESRREEAIGRSLYRDQPPAPATAASGAELLAGLWSSLCSRSLAELRAGRVQ